MQNIAKFYRWKIKSSLKLPRLWILLTVLFLWWFVIPYSLFTFGDRALSSFEERENSTTVKKETFKKIVTDSLNSEKSFEGNKEQEKLIKESTEKIIKLSNENAEGNKREINSLRIKILLLKSSLDSSVFGLFSLPFNNKLTNFICNKSSELFSKENFNLVDGISLWNLGGFLFVFYLSFWIIDFLFIKPKESGEEAIILTFTPRAKRSELFLANLLVSLTLIYIFCLLGFFLPFLIYYLLVGGAVTFGKLLMLFLWTTILGPILHFGLILIPYLFLSSKKRIFGTIFSYLFKFFSFSWKILFAISPASLLVKIIKLENNLSNIAIRIFVSLICGGIFLYLYYQHYEKEDIK